MFKTILWSALFSFETVFGSSSLVVGGGYAGGTDSLNSFEAWHVNESVSCGELSLDSNSSWCIWWTLTGRIPDFPTGFSGSYGAILDNKVTVCLGQGQDVNLRQVCYALDTFQGFWVPITVMPKYLSYGSSVVLPNDEWLLTGSRTTDTLIYTDEGRWIDGPAMPANTSKPCLLLFNSTHLFLSHGMSYFYNLQTEVFTPLATANNNPNQQYLSCVLLDDTHILMLGNNARETFIYDVVGDKWDEGAKLAKLVYDAELLWHDGRILMVGGIRNANSYSQTVEQLLSNGSWVELEMQLFQARSSFIALSAPSETIVGC